VIETTIPEINVAELMERVRAEALRPKKLPPRESAVVLPPVVMLPAAPAVWIPGTVKSRKARLDALAARGVAAANVYHVPFAVGSTGRERRLVARHRPWRDQGIAGPTATSRLTGARSRIAQRWVPTVFCHD
jgi:hypothetical protein